MPAKPAQPKTKSRVTTRMKEAVGVTKARNRSADLMKLSDQFTVFVKKLKGLLVVLKNHHSSMMNLQKTRQAVAEAVAKMADRSPIFDCIGELPSPDRPPEQVCSYLSIHTKVTDKSKSYISKYAQFVIEYVIEWEKVVTGRISVALKQAENRRVDLDHYQQKVESLRQSANISMAKGKMVDGKSADRLSRNEEKFIKAKQEYDVFATDLCILIEEVTERSWRDLHPLLIKLAQFDVTMSDDEAKMMKQMNNVVKDLKDVAARNKLSPQARLKDIEHQKAELLNTRQGGDLRIEAGEDDGSVFGTTGAGAVTPVALPPGTVAPQGLGGFPVQVADDSAARARTASYASEFSAASGADPSSSAYGLTNSTKSTLSGAPTISDIANMSSAAAPPPTMDQLNDAYRSSSISDTPPALGMSSMTLPPAPAPAGGNAYASADSLTVYSGASAPAPAAPPPPPPMGAPPPPPHQAPPPPMGMYPPAGGAPPAQPAYPGYPPQQPGYPGYPPAQPGYPPAQPGYPPAQPGYPPQQPGYPPQQPAYPLQLGYPPQPQTAITPYGQPPAPYGAPPAAPYGMPRQQPPQHQQSWGSAPGGRTPLNSTNPFG